MSIWNQFQSGRLKYFVSVRQVWSIFFCWFEAICSTFITSDWYFKVLSKWLTTIYLCHRIIAFWKKNIGFSNLGFFYFDWELQTNLYLCACVCLLPVCEGKLQIFWIFWNCLECHMFLCLYIILVSVKDAIASIFVDSSI